MSETALFELGSEELPPKALLALAKALAAGVAEGLAAANLDHGPVQLFATPRRLAVRIPDLAERQPDQEIERRGPPIKAAFDDSGSPTRAALAFAEKNATTVDALDRVETPKGEWLIYRGREAGLPATDVLPKVIEEALARLPIPKPMRWGAHEQTFVRPVHWVLLLLGDRVVPARVLGLTAGAESRGHRVHGQQTIKIANPDDYEETLRANGVIVDFHERIELIRELVTQEATALGRRPELTDELLEEVAALVEWPTPISGRFDERFLALPREVLTSTLKDHQRFFPLMDDAGSIAREFIGIANIDSREPDAVREGYERVIQPRLADAEFFFNKDQSTTLAARRESLKSVQFQAKLGSLYDVTERVAALAVALAEALGAPKESAQLAGELSRSDLVTDMVGEFPELQGVMGRYYAIAEGLDEAVATALAEQYLPRFAGDDLPRTLLGSILAIASKLDLVTGIFAIKQKPTGTKDPFGVRRAALGLVRIAVEQSLDLDWPALIRLAGRQIDVEAAPNFEVELYDYLLDRLPSYYDGAYETQTINAVLALKPTSLADADARIKALHDFSSLAAADSLAAANKRVANLLRKAGADNGGKEADPKALVDAAEKALHQTLSELRLSVPADLESKRYGQVMNTLAGTREVVDAFFDEVMVMADDPGLRANRLALLKDMQRLYNGVADLSRLA